MAAALGGAGAAEEQERWLADALSVVKQQAFHMKRALDANNIREALKFSALMLSELRTSKLSPQKYYELYMRIFDDLRHLESFFGEANRNGRSCADLYELVQHAGNVVPRLYLLCTVGSVYIKSKEAPAKDVLKDLVEMTRGVQHPVRGLFLRSYLSQISRDKLPDVGSEYAGEGGAIEDAVEFVLQNFTEMNKLWVRMQHQGGSKEKERREKERSELRDLVGKNLHVLSQLEGVHLEMYESTVLPRILEQVVNCKDEIAQFYLMDCVIQVFPDDFHLRTLQTLLGACPQLQPGVDVKTVMSQLMDRLSKYAAMSPEVLPEFLEVDAFSKFSEAVAKVIEAQPDMALDGAVSLHVSLLTFVLQVHSDRLDYVDHVLGAMVRYLEGRGKVKDVKATKQLMLLLTSPLEKFSDIVTVLLLENFPRLMDHLDTGTNKIMASVIVQSILKNGTIIQESATVEALLDLLKELIQETDDAVPLDESDHEDFLDEQGLVAKLVHVLYTEDPEEMYKILSTTRKHLASGGSKRLPYTYPSLVFCTLKLVRSLQNVEESEEAEGVSRSKLFRFLHQAASECQMEDLAYEFFTQAFVLYEEDISDSKAQITAIYLIIGTLQRTLVFGPENRDTLTHKATGYSAKLLKRPDQCRAVYTCSHLFWNDDERGVRDGERVVLCLKRALKIANAAQRMSSATRGSSGPATLFVELLNKYLYFFDKGTPQVTSNVIQGLLQLIAAEMASESAAQDDATDTLYRNTVAHIAYMKQKGGEQGARYDLVQAGVNFDWVELARCNAVAKEDASEGLGNDCAAARCAHGHWRVLPRRPAAKVGATHHDGIAAHGVGAELLVLVGAAGHEREVLGGDDLVRVHVVAHHEAAPADHAPRGLRLRRVVGDARCGAGDAAHERTAVALGVLLQLFPHLLPLVQEYFSFAPPPFARLLPRASGALPFSAAPELSVVDILAASYRLLTAEAAIFGPLWDWSPLASLLLPQPAAAAAPTSENSVAAMGIWEAGDEGAGGSQVRWLAGQALALVLRMGDGPRRRLFRHTAGLPRREELACILWWQELERQLAAERARFFLEPHLDPLSRRGTEASTSGPAPRRGGLYVSVCGVQLPRRSMASGKAGAALAAPAAVPHGDSMVLTTTTSNNLEAIAIALCRRRPVLLEGPSGVGKSALIDEVARLTDNFDVVKVHLDDQMDSKTLLGTYVCTDTPGEFRWQPGALTQAVNQGLWVVFEDVDMAPSEVLSALIPLLEDRRLYIPGRGEVVEAHPAFQMFATVTSGAGGRVLAGSDVLRGLWTQVTIHPAADNELHQIVESKFPTLAPIASKLIETLRAMKRFTAEARQAVSTETVAAGTDAVLVTRQFSTRDLLKLCKRLAALGASLFTGPVLSDHARELVFLEALDCFVGSVARPVYWQHMAGTIGSLWGVSVDRVRYFLALHKPTLQINTREAHIGRASLPVRRQEGMGTHQGTGRPLFAATGHVARLLEKIAVATRSLEPVLLVGETGTGKTAAVQWLARQANVPLTIVNMSQQSDSADLLGGFKPIESQALCGPLLDTFNRLFRRTFSYQHNHDFLARLQKFAEKSRWAHLLKAFDLAMEKVSGLLKDSKGSLLQQEQGMQEGPRQRKKRKQLDDATVKDWRDFRKDLDRVKRQVEASENAFAFSFVEGALVKALAMGRWLLLDEINLAPADTLERLTGVLEGEAGSLALTERGDVATVVRHEGFRIFACMNPATDVGKKDLPPGLRQRFTEIFVDELTEPDDLCPIVYQYMEGTSPSPPVDDVVNFYLAARREAEETLLDGANQRPQYSLRTLTRALEYTKSAVATYGFQRALFDGFSMSFLTLLERQCRPTMEHLIAKYLLKQVGDSSPAFKSLLRPPPQPSPHHVLFEHFWVEGGDALELGPSETPADSTGGYVLTESVREHLKNLARAVLVRKYPILLQGPTSSGKTSLIEYMAGRTGHRAVRINNHEHTDLQEYLGSYVTDAAGKLKFQEGILVEAVRKGYWIILDELNLMTIKPHPHFLLFATQNPPGIYGGRKVLSRAFRNRFMELHVDDIPESELRVILEKKSLIPGSYAMKMVEVMKELQRHRQQSQMFAGKHGFITARDLFRWADRHANGYEELATNGYLLLAERLRSDTEKAVVQSALERQLRVQLNPAAFHEECAIAQFDLLRERVAAFDMAATLGRIVWTRSFKRLFNLVERCLRHNEPVLLVGDTGTGKTTVCQLLGLLRQQQLHIINCHQHTETSDFLGGFRPIRDKDRISSQFSSLSAGLITSETFQSVNTTKVLPGIENASATLAAARAAVRTIEEQMKVGEPGPRKPQLPAGSVQAAHAGLVDLRRRVSEMEQLQQSWHSLFAWHDGPLVTAMKDGDMILVDEISLAEDSILERLNSVLEPKRLLVLAEKGGEEVEELIAAPGFRLLATMNPGGDFGKKELSPALRNRFTEIWVPALTDIADLRSIVQDRLENSGLEELLEPLLQFWQWCQMLPQSSRVLSIRDLLSWVTFIKRAEASIGMWLAYAHGAHLVLLDGLGLGMGLGEEVASQLRAKCFQFLLGQIPQEHRARVVGSCEPSRLPSTDGESSRRDMEGLDMDKFGIDPFFIAKGLHAVKGDVFNMAAPTTSRNAMRVLRAMQLPKAVLVEGSPGIGKTSLVSAIAAASGHRLVRINLSEQTDMMDLLGTDLPVDGGQGGEFAWSDGVFLQALKAGDWVLLDELNLASQSILEGLNACLDHRAEVFIPELGESVKCPPSFRIFACQNPLQQGGGRKGLPRSFLNRFTKVYVELLESQDLHFIAAALHPGLPEQQLLKMIEFNQQLYQDTMVARKYGHAGAPWEFNLRDVLRWCSLLEQEGPNGSPAQFLDLVYLQRMRTAEDRRQVLALFQRVFQENLQIETHPRLVLTSEELRVGLAVIQRMQGTCGASEPAAAPPQLLPGAMNALENLAHVVRQGWMSIIVGPAASGKTSLVRLLARLAGVRCHEYALTSGTDTTELLGCFEQRDMSQALRHLEGRVAEAVESACGTLLSSAEDARTSSSLHQQRLQSYQRLQGLWASFKQKAHCAEQDTDLSSKPEEQVRVEKFLALDSVMEELETVAKYSDLEAISAPVTELRAELCALREAASVSNVGRFQWVDGVLLKALERGDWVVLDNANFCNPSVLDRLNPLLEPGGCILVNERGMVEGRAVVATAHPRFRLFLLMDPAAGEVSRAMRNRGVEIFLLPPNWQKDGPEEPVGAVLDAHSNTSCQLLVDLGLYRRTEGPLSLTPTDTSFRDSLRILALAGIPGWHLPVAMSGAHEEAQALSRTVTTRELAHWASLTSALLVQGTPSDRSLASGWLHTYRRHSSGTLDFSALQHVFDRHMHDGQIGVPEALSVSLAVPLQALLQDPEATRVLSEGHLLAVTAVTSIVRCASALWRDLVQQQGPERAASQWQQRQMFLTRFVPADILQSHLLGPQEEVPCRAAEAEDLQLRYAGLWFVELADSADAPIRLQMLEAWATVLQGTTSGAASMPGRLATAYAAELAHPISMEVLKQQPAESANLMRALEALRATLWQGLEEADVLRAVPQGAGGSTIQQSFRYCTRLDERGMFQASHAMVAVLYPLFCSLRQLEEAALVEAVSNAWSPQLHVAFVAVLEWHAAMWRLVCELELDKTAFLLTWRSLKAALMELLGCVKQMGFSELDNRVQGVTQVAHMLDQAWGLAGGPAGQPLLWEHGGHPPVAPSLELFEEDARLLAVCESLSTHPLPDGDRAWVASTSTRTRWLALEGLSLLRWYSQLRADAKTCSLVPERTFEVGVLLRSWELLEERVQAERASYSAPHWCDLVPTTESVADNRREQLGPLRFPASLLRWPSSRTLWYQLLPLLDQTTLVRDLDLLARLAKAVYVCSNNGMDAHQCTYDQVTIEDLKQALDYGLATSSRSPAGFVPHQHLIWVMQARQSQQVSDTAGDAQVMRVMVQELWYRWHAANWQNTLANVPPSLVNDQDPVLEQGLLLGAGSRQLAQFAATAGPARLYQSSRTTFTASLLMTGATPIKDHTARRHQLQLAAQHLWQGASEEKLDLATLDLGNASHLFMETIWSHRASFASQDVDAIGPLMAELHAGIVQELTEPMQRIPDLAAILSRSTHAKLRAVSQTFIVPCATILHGTAWTSTLPEDIGSQSSDGSRGKVWTLLGAARLHLLLPADGCDPAARIAFEKEHLERKLSALRVEIVVREASEGLRSGQLGSRKVRALISQAARLQREIAELSKQVCLRPSPPQFHALFEDVTRFLATSASSHKVQNVIDRLEGYSGATEAQIFQEISTWQGTIAQFISHLSTHYPMYRDICQPIQLALYELMYGSSIMLLHAVSTGQHQRLNDLLIKLMGFPHVIMEPKVVQASQSTCTSLELPEDALSELLTEETKGALCQLSASTDKDVVLELELSLLHVSLTQIAHRSIHAGFKSCSAIQIVGKTMKHFADIWSTMKESRRAKELAQEEEYRYKVQTTTLETEDELDEAAYQAQFGNHRKAYADLIQPEMASAEEDDERADRPDGMKDSESNDDENHADRTWLLLHEHLLARIVELHDWFFTSKGHAVIPSNKRLDSFTTSYSVGLLLLKALGMVGRADVDSQTQLGHLLRLCVEYEQITKVAPAYERQPSFESSQDINAAELSLLLKPLAALLKRVGSLLDEWPEHPILMQLVAISERVLGLTSNAPLMKALVGLELLVEKAQLWEVNAAKFVSLAAELDEVSCIIMRWRKLELASWPLMLESMRRKHEDAAEKARALRLCKAMYTLPLLLLKMTCNNTLELYALWQMWFMLYDLLHRPVGEDLEDYVMATMSSLEEFLQTASYGDFQKRLRMLLAFHRQLLQQLILDNHSPRERRLQQQIADVLFNLHSYYSQFLPELGNTLAAGTGPLERELKDFVRLAKWEDRNYYSMAASAEKAHRKLHKILRKFDVLLKQPMLQLLTKLSQKGGQLETLDASKVTITSSANKVPTRRGLTQPADNLEERKELQDMLRGLTEQVTALTLSNHSARAADSMTTMKNGPYYLQHLPSLVAKMAMLLNGSALSQAAEQRREEGYTSLEEISEAIIERSQALKEKETKKNVKKKALVDLLRLLRQVGLSHRKTSVPLEDRDSRTWYLQPAVHVEEEMASLTSPGLDGQLDLGTTIPTISATFSRADAYYLQNMCLIQSLWQGALSFNKDLSLREVDLSVKYTEHLLHWQQTQRRRMLKFAHQISQLTGLAVTLKHLGGVEDLPPQAPTIIWIQRQKAYLDTLSSMLLDMHLLISTAVRLGVTACSYGQGSAPSILAVTSAEKLLMDSAGKISSCKERLDTVLFGGPSMLNTSRKLPIIVTPAMRDLVAQNFHMVGEIRVRWEAAIQAEYGRRRVMPGWESLKQSLDEGHRLEQAFEAEQPATRVLDGPAAESLSAECERAIQEVLKATQALVRLNREVSAASPVQSETTDNRPCEVPDNGGATEDLESRDSCHSSVQEQTDTDQVTLAVEGTIMSWSARILEQMEALRLDKVASAVGRTIENLRLLGGGSHAVAALLASMHHMHYLLQLLRVAALALLRNYARLHKGTAKLGYVLANLFCALFKDGYCTPVEEKAGDEGGGQMEDASGTGMGEGQGRKDVSDEIEDEEQLVGTEEKEKEKQEHEEPKSDVKDKKGIEMEQDFDGELFDISSDEYEENEAEEEDEDEPQQQLDQEMGDKGGEDEEVVDEKLWREGDDEGDGKEEGREEKFEKDAPVSGVDEDQVEYRAKQELEEEEEREGEEGKKGERDQKEERKAAAQEEEGGEEAGGKNSPDEVDEDETGDAAGQETEESHRIQPRVEEELELKEDMELDGGEEEEKEGEDAEDGDEQQQEHPEDAVNTERMAEEDSGQEEGGKKGASDELPQDDVVDEEVGEREKQLGAEAEPEEGAGDVEEAVHAELERAGAPGPAPAEDVTVDVAPVPAFQQAPQDSRKAGEAAAGVSSGSHSQQQASQAQPVPVEQQEVVGAAPGEPAAAQEEQRQSFSRSARGEETVQPQGEEEERRAAGEAEERKRLDANPNRSLGDILRQWQEQVQLLGGAEEERDGDAGAAEEEEQDGDRDRGRQAKEYEYVGKQEVGGDQALGAATEEQLLQERHRRNDGPDKEMDDPQRPAEVLAEEAAEVTMEEAVTKPEPQKRSGRLLGESTIDQDDELRANGLLPEKEVDEHDYDVEMEEEEAADDSGEAPGVSSFVAVRHMSALEEAAPRLSEQDAQEVRRDVEHEVYQWQSGGEEQGLRMERGRAAWQHLEQLTGRLAMELAEQLRLILEPTLATKLAGDYRTGKRINMKKVIPYIASQFRKDKIWLRRTKPNKRDYQVLLAIDDSRSMAETRCGHLALEAMATIAKALGQLEIAQLAVVSFGQTGQVRLVHPFERPFSSEAGAQVVSQFSFRQENTIVDEPGVDLLKFLGRLLETAALRASAASSRGTLQQLVLIIADGRFHEKESLRRRVREAMSRRQLLAFIVLDNPKDSILDMQSVSFAGGGPTFTKYLDTFPFPYYILLNDIEALPRTLADLLRQIASRGAPGPELNLTAKGSEDEQRRALW
eukprot:SM000004S14910  [mRNA]  locus=s4:133208:176671:- [translate_table: standard]